MKLDNTNLMDILISFVHDYCKKNSIPTDNMEDYVVFLPNNDNTESVELGFDYVPCGNTACLFDTMNVKFKLEIPKEHKNLWFSVTFKYTHPGGGSNGITFNNIVTCNSDLPDLDKLNYVGYIDHETLYAYKNA